MQTDWLCVPVRIVSVLCAPASKVGHAEWVRASLLLCEMGKLDSVVLSELYRPNEEGTALLYTIFEAPSSVFAEMLAKESSEWTCDDAILASANMAAHVLAWAAGHTRTTEPVGLNDAEFLGQYFSLTPYQNAEPKGTSNRYIPLALLCQEIVRSEADSQPEELIAGAAGILCWMSFNYPPVALALWEAGFLDVFTTLLQRWNPLERVSRRFPTATAIVCSFKDVVQGVIASRIEVMSSLLDAGAADLTISLLSAYQMLGRPEEASVAVIQWGALFTLEVMLASAQAAPIITQMLRSAGADAFRYLLNEPLVNFQQMGFETGVSATRIAAQVWGRDDDGSGLTFLQQDIDKIVHVSNQRDPKAAVIRTSLGPMTASYGQVILNLCVSDLNKELLLNAEGLVPLLLDLLLLDPEHPCREQADFDAFAPAVQRDFTEAITQLAMFPPGREALLRDPTVAEALRQVAAEGWTQESQNFAESALLAMSDRQPDADQEHRTADQEHVMLSYQWDVQEVVRRVVNELQFRGYQTWFDLDNMKGSTMDAMGHAVDNAAVMISCISLAYKESANCRLEAQYGHQMEVDLIPLMMEEGYRATGWLGMLLGNFSEQNKCTTPCVFLCTFLEHQSCLEQVQDCTTISTQVLLTVMTSS